MKLEDFEKEYIDKHTLESMLLDGLVYDGGHHKQWFLKMALIKKLGSVEATMEYIRKEYDFNTYDEYLEEYGDFGFCCPA